MIDTAAIREWHPVEHTAHYPECELHDEFCAIAKLCDEVDRLRAELKRYEDFHVAAMVKRDLAEGGSVN
jgi:hypothetical protein